MTSYLLKCSRYFDGESDQLGGATNILVTDGVIEKMGPDVTAPEGVETVDLGDRTVTPGFIDTHVHLTMGSPLATQTLWSEARKALTGLSLAQAYRRRGFTTIRDLGSADPAWPVVEIRNAINRGLVDGPRVLVAGHFMSPTGGHGDIDNFYDERWGFRVSSPQDSSGEIRRAVRREHRGGSDWIKTTSAGGYHSDGDDPGVCTWFDDEMDTVCATASQLNMDVAVHCGSADSVIQAIKAGVRSLEHAYLIDEEGIALAESSDVFIVPTTYLTVADSQWLDSGEMPEYISCKFGRDVEQIKRGQKLIAASSVPVAFGTDAGMFPFDEGPKEFAAMVACGIDPARALRAGMSVAADLLRLPTLGRLAPGMTADIVAMPGNPLQEITATESVDFVMQGGRVIRHDDAAA